MGKKLNIVSGVLAVLAGTCFVSGLAILSSKGGE